MAKRQIGIFLAMIVVLGFVFARVAYLKEHVRPLREILKEREKQEDLIRHRATEPIIRSVHMQLMALRDDFPELSGYGPGNLFVQAEYAVGWQHQRRIFFNSLLQNNDRPAPDGIKLHVSFCSRNGPLYYCSHGQIFGRYYIWQENKIRNLGISLTCSIDSSNPALLREISRICDETAGGTMEIIQQQNIDHLRTERP